MNSEIKCRVCGGTDFYLEAGQYYCSECQTLTQDLQEVVAEGNFLSQTIKTQKKERVSKNSLKEQVTSWECYNYILRGLVEELIECGADEQLKQVVKVLWFKYLKNLKVIHDDPTKPPQLQAHNIALDAETIYNRKISKRKRSNSPSSQKSVDVEINGTLNNARKINKRKKQQVLAEYEEIKALEESQRVEASQSLSALKSDIEVDKKKKVLKYAPDAKKELKKVLTTTGFLKHVNNVEDIPSAQTKIIRMDLPKSYKRGATVLNPNKLYILLSLGLLIIKDNVTISDMLRFINEGFLSYGDVDHLYPEEYDEARKNIPNLKHSRPVTHRFCREIGFKMIEFLNIKQMIPIPNLVSLCERFCGELNLPDQFKDIVIKIMAKSAPDLRICKTTRTIIPNYEARVYSFIIFTLKCLFGLDDVTEFKISIYAETVNLNSDKQTMFNIKNWLNFISYRKTIMTKYHFPTQHYYSRHEFDRSYVYINFLKESHKRLDLRPDDLMDYNILKIILDEVKEKKPVKLETHSFERTFTPMQDYLKVLKASGSLENKNYLTEILDLNFKDDSFDYLLNEKKYLPSDTRYNFGGAVQEYEIVELTRRVRNDFAERKLIYCDLEKKTDKKEKKGQTSTKCEEDIPQTSNSKSNRKLIKQEKKSKLKQDLKRAYPIHYRPEMKFWLHSIVELEAVDVAVFNKYFNSLPNTFRMIVTECAYLSSQSLKEFMEEYVEVEFYLTHNLDINTGGIKATTFGSYDVNKLSKDAMNNW